MRIPQFNVYFITLGRNVYLSVFFSKERFFSRTSKLKSIFHQTSTYCIVIYIIIHRYNLYKPFDDIFDLFVYLVSRSRDILSPIKMYRETLIL